MSKRKIIVVGAGPSGLMAAGAAAEPGAKILLLEKKHHPGLKLRITGGGRCNLTNLAPLSDFIAHLGPGGHFLRQAFSQFFTSDLLAFMKERGVRTMTETDGRVFPASGQAEDVANALARWVVKCGVTLLADSPVKRLIVEEGRIVGVQSSYGSARRKNRMSRSIPRNRIYHADAVILACGGASYPTTGSEGDGYRLAESVGHTIVPIRPALVPVETAGNITRRLQGLSLRDVKVRIRVNEKKRAEAAGEMLFTHFGLSGPTILTLSRLMVDALRQNQKVALSIDLKPSLDDCKLNELLQSRLRENSKQKIQTILKEILPKKLIPVCLDLTGIHSDKVGNQVTAAERKRLYLWLKDFRLEVIGFRPFTEAMITAGGVDTKEVDPRTMESRLVNGLYFAGEVLDIDADTGGYNLQAAFSTGWVAGRSAARLQ